MARGAKKTGGTPRGGSTPRGGRGGARGGRRRQTQQEPPVDPNDEENDSTVGDDFLSQSFDNSEADDNEGHTGSENLGERAKKRRDAQKNKQTGTNSGSQTDPIGNPTGINRAPVPTTTQSTTGTPTLSGSQIGGVGGVSNNPPVATTSAAAVVITTSAPI